MGEGLAAQLSGQDVISNLEQLVRDKSAAYLQAKDGSAKELKLSGMYLNPVGNSGSDNIFDIDESERTNNSGSTGLRSFTPIRWRKSNE